MVSILILYQGDHDKRALALKNALVNTAEALPVDTPALKIAGLKTLIFWGHGLQHQLCGKTADQVVRIVKDWRDVNDQLDTVEIITCNSRHYDPDMFAGAAPKVYAKSFFTHLLPGQHIDNSIAKQIKRGLKYHADVVLHAIKVLSMPKSLHGARKRESILYWDQATTSWCYVTGKDAKEMSAIGYNIQLLKRNPPHPDFTWGKPRVGDFPTKLAAAKIEFPDADYRDAVAGLVHQLRGILTTIN